MKFWTFIGTTTILLHAMIRCRIVRSIRSHMAFSSSSDHRPLILQQTIVPGTEHQSELEIKKSRFIGYARHVDSWSEAQAYMNTIKQQEHPKARHWCFAYCGGHPPRQQERSSDDGEPTGTAGAPILQAIRSEDLSDTLCVVVRYFGGIRLGAGGLIRAYGAAARQVLREAPRTQSVPQSNVRVQVDAVHIGTVYDIVSKCQGRCEDEAYDADGKLEVTVICATSEEEGLRTMLLDSTRGNICFLTVSDAMNS
jgi:uncharacterized YigZ family protein